MQHYATDRRGSLQDPSKSYFTRDEINLVLIPQGAADAVYSLLFSKQPQSRTEIFKEIKSPQDISCLVKKYQQFSHPKIC